MKVWKRLNGDALSKVERMFRPGVWYVYPDKIFGKTVFMRDHGVVTLYVIGPDDYVYSLKATGIGSEEPMRALVDAAMHRDPSRARRWGVYKNERPVP